MIDILTPEIHVPLNSTGTAPPYDLKMTLKQGGGAVCDDHYQYSALNTSDSNIMVKLIDKIRILRGGCSR